MADLGVIETEESHEFWGNQKRVVTNLHVDWSAYMATGKTWRTNFIDGLSNQVMTNPKKLYMQRLGLTRKAPGGAMIYTTFSTSGPQYGIYGTVTYEDDPGAGLTLRLYERSSGELLAETVSDGAGNYDFDFRVPEGYKYYVIAFDTNLVPIYNAKIRDYLDPKLIT